MHPVNYFPRFLDKNIEECPPSKLFLFIPPWCSGVDSACGARGKKLYKMAPFEKIFAFDWPYKKKVKKRRKKEGFNFWYLLFFFANPKNNSSSLTVRSAPSFSKPVFKHTTHSLPTKSLFLAQTTQVCALQWVINRLVFSIKQPFETFYST